MRKAKLLNFISRHDIFSYLCFTFGLGWFFYIAGSLIVYDHPERFFWLYLFQSIGAAMTLAGGIVVRYARGGKKEVEAGWEQYKRWKKPVGLYLFAILLLPHLAVVSLIMEGKVQELALGNGTGWVSLAYFPLVFLVQLPGSPLLEEYGWRGFLQQRLQQRFSALAASLIIGALWGLHHLPLILATEGSVFRTVLGAVLASVLFGWLLNTGRSILLVLLFHASLNVATLITSDSPAFYWLTGAAAVSFVLYSGTANLSRKERLTLNKKRL